MSAPRIILINGFAQPSDGCAELAALLRRPQPVESLAVHELAGEGHGPGQFSYAAELAARCAGSPVVLIGWSMGGMVALEAAAILGDALKGLVLFGATGRLAQDPLASDYPGVSAPHFRAMRRQLAASPERFLRDFLAAVYHPNPPPPPERLERALAWEHAELCTALEYLATVDIRSALAAILQPTLILHGTEDRIVPVESAGVLAQQLVDAHIELLPGAGHAACECEPQKVARSVLRFLKDKLSLSDV